MSMQTHALRWTQTLFVNRWGSIRVDSRAVCSCGRFTSKPRLSTETAQRAWESHAKAKRERR